MAKTLLILGVSYVGLTVAHKLLKGALNGRQEEWQVVLVNSSTHMYWNMASVRAIVPGQIPDEKLFSSIPEGFAKYGKAVEFIEGTATALEPTTKTVTIESAGGSKKIVYDTLVIATGGRTIDSFVPWKSAATGYKATKENLHKTQKLVEAAESIVIGGAGPTGVETAGELGFEFGKTKKITLVTAGSQLLTGVPSHVAKQAETELKRLNVEIIYDTKVLSSTEEAGKTILELSTGSKLTTALYLPTVGTIPNTEFIPKEFLNATTNEVSVDEYLRVKNLPDAWAAGDVTDIEPSQYVYGDKQAATLAKNLDLVLTGKQPVVYTPASTPVMGVTIGRSKATGRMGNMKLPSIVIWFAKGRTLGVQKLQGLVSGA